MKLAQHLAKKKKRKKKKLQKLTEGGKWNLNPKKFKK